jgi:phosphatidate phosphatase LPIN
MEEGKSEENVKIPSFNVKENNLTPKNSDCLFFERKAYSSNVTYKNYEYSKKENEEIKKKEVLKSVELSLCHNEILKNPDKAEEIFHKNLIKKEEFLKDPWKILNNSNLLISYEEKLYTYKAAAPLLFSLLAFGEPLPDMKIDELLTNKSVFSVFSSKKMNISDIKLTHNEEGNLKKKRHSIPKVKSFVPTANELKMLGLKEGKNEISFVCKTRLSGQQILTADIYLWEYNSKIVISDIDGTITRSDVLGQIMPIIGKDWSHDGVTELFTNIEKNGYKILYLTARAICQATATKNYLHSLFQSIIKY